MPHYWSKLAQAGCGVGVAAFLAVKVLMKLRSRIGCVVWVLSVPGSAVVCSSSSVLCVVVVVVDGPRGTSSNALMYVAWLWGVVFVCCWPLSPCVFTHHCSVVFFRMWGPMQTLGTIARAILTKHVRNMLLGSIAVALLARRVLKVRHVCVRVGETAAHKNMSTCATTVNGWFPCRVEAGRGCLTTGHGACSVPELGVAPETLSQGAEGQHRAVFRVCVVFVLSPARGGAANTTVPGMLCARTPVL